ncbi:substrate-binding periplasmic protein [Bdellovibrio sp. HCB288]|uniref:substrate-binding periplasmic protein n=1 Tax=Bdellovibrio sp. HCB288 TaxID=3394355 RepID=UPI0039B45A5D
MWLRLSVLFFSVLCPCVAAFAVSPQKTHLIAFEFGPYINKNLPEGGAVIAGLKEMYRKNGQELVVTFAPVIRTKKHAAENNKFDGYFPATAENIQKNFTLSSIVHSSSWGLAERTDNPVRWNKFEDLGKYKIGNVIGYDLAAVLIPLNAAGKLKIEDGPTDELNLVKLANGRLDLVFIDEGLFDGLLQTSKQLQPFKTKLQFNAKPIEHYDYGVAFKDTDRGRKALNSFNGVFDSKEFAISVGTYLKKNKKLFE